MRKRDGIQWTSLEGKGEPLKIKQPLVASGGGGQSCLSCDGRLDSVWVGASWLGENSDG